jgi:streptomycin 6-kinase
LERTEGGVRPAPWDESGWRDAADAWIREELARLHRPLTGPIEVVKQWCLSCVLRAPTDAGSVFFKAAVDLPLFVDEPAVLEGLSTLFPNNIPTVLAREPAQRWMLMEESGKTFRWEDPPGIEIRERTVATYARMQRMAAERADALLRFGCLDRRLPVLTEQIAPLLALADTLPDLADETKAELHAFTPRLHELCAELLVYQIPSSLAHGDLHMGNVAIGEDGTLVYFDWTDACLTYPFIDMITIFGETDAATKERLRDAYLAEWTEYESPERLLTAFAIAAPLSALHQTVSYQYIAAFGPPNTQAELGNAVGNWLRCLVRRLNEM